MEYFILLRDLIVNNFCVSLKSVEFKERKTVNSTYFLFLRLIPFYFVKMFLNFMNFKYIYLVDDIYFSNYSPNKIYPVINSAELIQGEEKKIITNQIKKYSYTIPFWYIYYNENLKDYEKIQFRYFFKGKIETKVFEKDLIVNKYFYEIF